MSQRAIAKRAGCALSTVSRALAGDPKVRPATRLRVLAAATALGYLAPSQRTAPADPRCRTLAVVLGPHSGPPVPDTLRTDLLGGVAEAATALGLTVQVVRLEPAEELALRDGNLPHTLTGVGLRGAILLGIDDPTAARGLASRLPCVQVGNDLHLQEPWTSLNINQYAATVLMLDHLLHLGHRRIGFVRAVESGDRGAERLGAFVAGMALRDRPVRAGDLLSLRRKTGFAQAITASRGGVTAWISDSQATGEGLVAALSAAGLRVPARVSVVSFCSSTRSRPPQLTGVFGPWLALGRAAVLALANPPAPTEPGRRLLLDVTLEAGRTAAPPPRAFR